MGWLSLGTLPWAFSHLCLSWRHHDPTGNRLLFSDPAYSSAEFPLGLPGEFLVMVSVTFLPLGSWEEKRSLPPRG